MSISRTLCRTRCYFPKNCTSAHFARPALLSIRTSIPWRQISTTARSWQETVQTPSRGVEGPLTTSTSEPAGSHARSVAILRVPKRATRPEIEELVRSKGLEITHMQLRLDRFTFHNDGRCFIEFSSEEQAQQAVRDLNKAQFMDHELSAVPLMDDFVWGPDPQKHKPRYFYEHEKSASEPLKPLLERRRMIFSVQTPGWGKKNKSTGHNNIASQIIDESFGKYGLEAVGGLQPFYGDKQPTPRFLCFLDFATKSGADQAAQAIHDTEIQGRRVWLKPSVLAPWRAHHIGKTEPALLAQLQEKGLAPKEVYEDSFVDSDRRKGKENYKTTRIERTNKRKAQRAETDA